MKIFHLAFQEILYRKPSFCLALLAIAVAVAHAVNAILMIQAQRMETEQRVAALDDEMRKVTKAMGFNINILPADQNLQSFYAEDFAQKTMPYEYVQKLADSTIVTSVKHLRPALIQKLAWKERNRQIIVMGVQGVIPFTHLSNPKKPMTEAVPKQAIHVGSVLANELGLKSGDDTVLNGESFKIDKVYAARGNKDDITVWIDLERAQKMVDLPDQINLIQALECNCSTPDRLAQIETEISQVLGGKVQVIELSTPAIARAKVRTQVAAEGKVALEQLKRRSITQIAILSVVVTIVVAVLSWLNVRERRSEIGILRAVGASTQKLLGLFISRAILIGVLGAIFGCTLGIASAKWMSATQPRVESILIVAMLLITPLITAIACWIPVTMAATQDAASILSEE